MHRSLRRVAVLLALAACRHANALEALESSVEQQYHMPVTVREPDTTRLMISLHGLPDSLVQADTGKKQAFARSVAGFAKVHYARRSALSNIGVVFVATPKGESFMVATQGNGPYQFASSELP